MNFFEWHYMSGPGLPRPQVEVPEIVKRDCQKLVDGQLLFDPSKKMRQGQSYSIFARLSRSPGVNISEGLNDSQFVIVKEGLLQGFNESRF
jgi:hypothetical protein